MFYEAAPCLAILMSDDSQGQSWVMRGAPIGHAAGFLLGPVGVGDRVILRRDYLSFFVVQLEKAVSTGR
ncbi:hypothetical protein DSUL_20053 [Desulfovibrionales bacterium]